jgi:hypothetical protein
MFLFSTSCENVKEQNPLVGRWAMSLPDSYPVWLRIDADTTAQLLWGVGSAKPIEINAFENDQIVLFRVFGWRPYGMQDVYSVKSPMMLAYNENGTVNLTVQYTFEDEQSTLTLTGKKMPPLPPRPDLKTVEFGKPIDLLANGIEDWKLTNPNKTNGWRIEDGILINETPKKDFGAYGNYGNLRTVDEFMDFELKAEYNVPKGGNSGVYLRGTYEVQVVDRDSPMQGIQGPGAVFGRIKPTSNNANEGGEWNTYRLLLVDRHITVELNGKTVIDNQPLEGCTGGGINADDTVPGPIFLQGDHTSVMYRNMVLREVL